MKNKLKLPFVRGVMLALGLTAGALLSVAVTGTVNTFNSGDSLTSSLMNQNFTSLKTAIEGIPEWTKNGVNAYYMAGNVGIGTTNPANSFKTEIVNANNQLQLTSTSTGANTNAHLSFKKYSTATDFDTWGIALSGGNDGIGLNQQGSLGFFSGTQAGYNGFKMVLAANGNVGIGTNNPSANLNIKNQSDAATRTLVTIEDINVAGTGGTNLLIQGSGTVSREISIANIWSKMHLGASAAGSVTQRLTIDTNGSVGIGTNAPSQTLTVNGNAGNTTGVWVNNSDERLKKNILPLGNFLDKLVGLRPVTFEWKNPQKINAKEGKHIGFIAQEVEKIFPFWVDTDKDGMKWISPEGINAVFVQAFKELSSEGGKTFSRLQIVETRLTELEKENKILRRELDSLKNQNQELKSIYKRLERLETKYRGN